MMEQLVIILIVVVVLVVLDGLRRRWVERRDRVVIKLDRKGVPPPDIDEDELFRSELPNGGARTVARRSEPARPRKSGPRLKSLQQQREQVKPEHVPVLLESVELEEERIEHTNVYADTSSTAPRDTDAGSRNAPIDAVVESLTVADEEATMGKYEESIDDYLQALDGDLRDANALQGRKGTDENDDETDDADSDVWEDDWDVEGDELDADDEDDDEDGDESWEEPWSEDWDPEDGDEERLDTDDDEDEDEDDYEDEDDDYEDEDDDDDYEDEDDDYEDDDDYEVDDDDEEVFLDPYDDYEDDPYARNEPAGGEQAGVERVASQGRHRSSRGRGKGEERVEPTLGSLFPGRDHQGELFQEADVAGTSRDKAAAALKEADAAPEAASQDASQKPEGAGTAGAANELQEVLIINVMARPGRVFSGRDLLPLLQAQGMQLGDMSIFHKHTGRDASGAVQYSMANMVKPGTFDLAGMDAFTTPGVSLFMQLPNQAGNMEAFDSMLDTARALQQGLDGELKDENRSVFTRQTIEHSRQRIRDFELKLLARK